MAQDPRQNVILILSDWSVLTRCLEEAREHFFRRTIETSGEPRLLSASCDAAIDAEVIRRVCDVRDVLAALAVELMYRQVDLEVDLYFTTSGPYEAVLHRLIVAAMVNLMPDYCKHEERLRIDPSDQG